jgi:hypothetical protein
MTTTTGERPEPVLTAAQWRRIQAICRAAERASERHTEPDTGDTEPPTWENQ